MTVVMIPVLIGFSALAVDVGRLLYVRGELQRAADAAAMAGASGLAGDGVITGDTFSLEAVAYARAAETSYLNKAFQDGVHMTGADVEYGIIAEPTNLGSPFVTGGGGWPNAVRVTARRTAGSDNGPIPLTFAAIFGDKVASITATATAVLDDRFAGVRPPASGDGPLIPFTISQERLNHQMQEGDDLFGYDDGDIKSVADGVREIWLFPEKLSGGEKDKKGEDEDEGEDNDGAGNFGILNVGNPSNGVPLIEQQILHGVTRDDLMREIGQEEIRFIDEDGAPVTHAVSGNPGIKAGMKDALEAKLGEIIGFFVHSEVTGTGSNAVFTIVDIRFGRLMEVDLTGSMKSKRVVVQPVSYAGSIVITAPNAAPTDGMVSQLMLVR